MVELQRIESRERFPVPNRPHYKIHLSKKMAQFFIQGREMDESELGDTIISLITALNAAEDQIEALIKVLREAEIDKSYLDEYLDEYPVVANCEHKYKIEDVKQAIHHAMMRQDEKLLSLCVNKLNVLLAKEVSHG
jgi:hypothetical protein